jgi:hypothetical protein
MISVTAALLLSGSALAGDTAASLGDHPAVTVARTGAHPGYESGMKVYGHPAGGTSSSAAPVESTLNQHPAVTVSQTGARPGYQEAMKVYGHPARGTPAIATVVTGTAAR